MIDRPVLARRIAAVRDAVARIGEVLPADAKRFHVDRTAREVVLLNLFVALQKCIALASHWLADEGWDVPSTDGEIFTALAEHGVIKRELAARLAAAAGLRNLVAHRYATIDPARIHAIARDDLDDLLVFCDGLAEQANSPHGD